MNESGTHFWPTWSFYHTPRHVRGPWILPLEGSKHAQNAHSGPSGCLGPLGRSASTLTSVLCPLGRSANTLTSRVVRGGGFVRRGVVAQVLADAPFGPIRGGMNSCLCCTSGSPSPCHQEMRNSSGAAASLDKRRCATRIFLTLRAASLAQPRLKRKQRYATRIRLTLTLRAASLAQPLSNATHGLSLWNHTGSLFRSHFGSSNFG